ncbi:hypothetical protein EON68_02590, partial [archaeon]
MFSPAHLSHSIARELVSIFGVITTSPVAGELLAHISPAGMYALPGAPAHAAAVRALSEMPPIAVHLPRPIAAAVNNPLMSLLHLPCAPSREQLARQVLVCLDYSVEGPARVLLRAWTCADSLGSGRVGASAVAVEAIGLRSPDVTSLGSREGSDSGSFSFSDASPAGNMPPALTVSHSFVLYAIGALRGLLRAGVPGFSEWGVQLLVHLMHSHTRSVALLALSICAEAAARARVYAVAIIARRPPLRRFSLHAITPLCLTLVQEPAGAALLVSQRILPSLLHVWAEVEFLRPLMVMEASLVRAFQSNQCMLDEVSCAGADGGCGTGNAILSPPATVFSGSTSASPAIQVHPSIPATDALARSLLPSVSSLQPPRYSDAIVRRVLAQHSRAATPRAASAASSHAGSRVGSFFMLPPQQLVRATSDATLVGAEERAQFGGHIGVLGGTAEAAVGHGL